MKTIKTNSSANGNINFFEVLNAVANSRMVQQVGRLSNANVGDSASTDNEKKFINLKNDNNMKKTRIHQASKRMTNKSRKVGRTSFITVTLTYNEDNGRIYDSVIINPAFAPQSIDELGMYRLDPTLCTKFVFDKKLKRTIKEYSQSGCTDYFGQSILDGFKRAENKVCSILSYFVSHCNTGSDESIIMTDAVKTTYDIAKTFKDIHIIKKDYRRVA